MEVIDVRIPGAGPGKDPVRFVVIVSQGEQSREFQAILARDHETIVLHPVPSTNSAKGPPFELLPSIQAAIIGINLQRISHLSISRSVLMAHLLGARKIVLISNDRLTEGDEADRLRTLSSQAAKLLHTFDPRSAPEVSHAPIEALTEIAEIFQTAQRCGVAVAESASDIDRVADPANAWSDQIETAFQPADQFGVEVYWLGSEPMFEGRRYRLCFPGGEVDAQVTELRFVIDPRNLSHLAEKKLEIHQIGVCNLLTSDPISLASEFEQARRSPIRLLDFATGEVLGFGKVKFALKRAHNVVWQSLDISRADRARSKGQKPVCLWLTGLSGSGKSTLANLLEKKLYSLGRHTFVLDGDNLRHGLNNDLGFTEADRIQNIRRASEVARLMLDAGLITIVSFISPFRADRELARSRMEPGEFMEIFVNTPLEVCESRDPKGLYRKARAGEIPNFTGISSPYEQPLAPELTIDTSEKRAEVFVDEIIAVLRNRGVI